MKILEQKIEEIVNKKIRPRTRVDGGDIKFEKFEDNTVYVGAYADCSVCRSCDPELTQWIEKELKKQLGLVVKVNITKYVPYFYK